MLAARPGWRAFARAEKSDNGVADRPAVEVAPSQGADLPSPLLMHTARREMPIGFDHHQAHPDWPPERTTLLAWAEPTAFAILDEDHAAASGWDGDRWAGS